MAVYIIDHGKHAGIALRKADILPELMPEQADFASAEYLEFGWGDWDYYQTPDPGVWVTLKAALWPTASVLHVAGIPGNPKIYFQHAEVIRLSLRRDGFMRMVRFIDGSFDRGGQRRAEPLRHGLYWDSRFYPARGSFHIFYTCNGWIAKALVIAGLPLGWPYPITSDQLMARIKKVVENLKKPDDEQITVFRDDKGKYYVYRISRVLTGNTP